MHMATTSPTNPAVAAGEKGRITAFDAFRGIAIVVVIYAHTTPFGWGYQENGLYQWEFWWSVFLRNFTLASLPLFLFLSGYLLGNTRIHNWAEYRGYLAKRVSRVAIPFLFWSCVFLAFSAWRTKTYAPGDLLFRLVTGQADGAYYFILMMLQFYVATPIFDMLLRKRGGLLAIFLAHAAFVAALYAVQMSYWPGMPYQVAKTPMFAWLSIFPMGMYVRRNPDIVQRIHGGFIAMATLLLLGLSFLESWLILRQGIFELGISDIRFMPLAYGYAVIFLFLKTVPWPWPGWLATLGGMSFGIFFIHGFVLRRVAGGLAQPALMEMLPLFQLLVTAATLAGCVTVILIARRLLPKDVNAKLLAF
jgi:surface polysaccharide O-acyltransferase-like enzyme